MFAGARESVSSLVLIYVKEGKSHRPRRRLDTHTSVSSGVTRTLYSDMHLRAGAFAGFIVKCRIQ